ncbi:hypothetical protein [Natronosalvus rutilus]|uniref:DUF8142 domain-containing protein n=1 Tax=Natronosalvus rutilus TaxID=2953753 RepID=A0A9E7STC4_9EURY|nr:hypothetical protein [Natronosalvus rutilus]UTF52390.1 hypothetical protein NGM29_11375 [Natronosalvus rutilus]
MGHPGRPSEDIDRRQAAIAVAPLVAVGLFAILLVVLWGANYLWGFVVALPVSFFIALAWIAFRSRPASSS